MKLEDLLKKTVSEVDNFSVVFPSGDGHSQDLEKTVEQYNREVASEEFPEYLLVDPEIVGYPDEEMQAQIYNWVLSDIKNESSVTDYGCGRGDFYGHCISSGYDIEYVGFDTKQIMISAGLKKYGGLHFNLLNFDFSIDSELSPVDYVVCIGTLNDNHGQDKWEYFNRTLNNAISHTKVAVVFVLSRNFDNDPNFLDYPFEELFRHLDKNLRFEIDYTKFEDIYKLTVHIGGYN